MAVKSAVYQTMDDGFRISILEVANVIFVDFNTLFDLILCVNAGIKNLSSQYAYERQ